MADKNLYLDEEYLRIYSTHIVEHAGSRLMSYAF